MSPAVPALRCRHLQSFQHVLCISHVLTPPLRCLFFCGTRCDRPRAREIGWAELRTTIRSRFHQQVRHDFSLGRHRCAREFSGMFGSAHPRSPNDMQQPVQAVAPSQIRAPSLIRLRKPGRFVPIGPFGCPRRYIRATGGPGRRVRVSESVSRSWRCAGVKRKPDACLGTTLLGATQAEGSSQCCRVLLTERQAQAEAWSGAAV